MDLLGSTRVFWLVSLAFALRVGIPHTVLHSKTGKQVCVITLSLVCMPTYEIGSGKSYR